jgi:branched-chain amino acid transport system substrate-binding protein
MSNMTAEIVVQPDGRSSATERDDIPGTLIRYARALLHTDRHSLHFLWRDGSRWLAVHLTKGGEVRDRANQPRISASAAPAWAYFRETSTVILRVAEIDVPRGVTVREIDVLTLVALGLTNGAIAERLGTSARTVSTQIERLLTKLDQETRGGLAALAVDSGLLVLPLPGGVEGPTVTAIGIVELQNVVLGASAAQLASTRPAYPRRRPILIGTLVPTGLADADGVEMQNGAQMAIEELNELGGISGRRVEHVTATVDLFDGTSVERALETLFDQDVDAITTSYSSAEYTPMLDLIADYGRPFLHTATFDEQVQLVESDRTRYGAIFQTCPSETHYGAGLVRLLTNLELRQLWRPRSRRIVSIEAESTSTRVTTEEFVATAAQAGWSLQDLIRAPIGMTDWTAVVARLAQLDPDVVMITHFLDRELAAFQRAFNAAGLPALVYCVYGASIPRFQEELGAAADGVVWSTTTGTYDDALGQRFRVDYGARFGTAPGWSQAGASYDQVKLLASAWSATNSRHTKDVVQYLRRSAYRGINGVYFLGGSDQASLSYPDVTPDPSMGQAHMVYQIQEGSHRVLGPEPFGTAANFRLPSWCAAPAR